MANQYYALEELRRLVDFATEKLSGYDFHIGKHKTRKGFLFQYMGAAHGLVRSVLNLLSSDQQETHAATILVRTLFEINVRVVYLFCSQGQQNVLKVARESYNNKIKTINKWETFLNANPHFKKGFSIDDMVAEVPSWQKIKTKIEKLFVKRYAHTSYDLPPNFHKVVEEVDAWNNYRQPNRKNKNSLTWNYLTVYRHLSQIVHLDIDGLNRYVNKTTGGYELMIYGDPDDMERLAITAYAFYFNVLDIFSRQFGTPTREELKPFRVVLKKFSKK